MFDQSECVHYSVRYTFYLLQLVYPASQSIHLDALLSGSAVQLGDGLLLLRAVALRLVTRLTHAPQLLLHAAQMLLLQGETERTV